MEIKLLINIRIGDLQMYHFVFIKEYFITGSQMPAKWASMKLPRVLSPEVAAEKWIARPRGRRERKKQARVFVAYRLEINGDE